MEPRSDFLLCLLFGLYKGFRFCKLSWKATHCKCGCHLVLFSLPCGNLVLRNWHKYFDAYVICCAVSNKVFVSDAGISYLVPAFMVLCKTSLFACKEGNIPNSLQSGQWYRAYLPRLLEIYVSLYQQEPNLQKVAELEGWGRYGRTQDEWQLWYNHVLRLIRK